MQEMTRRAQAQCFRRRSLLAAAAGLALIQPAFAQAPAWPTKPVTLIVPFAAGGATDMVARAIGEKLQAAIGQTVVVDNKAGGGTVIASNYTRSAAPDGHTLYVYPPGSGTMNILNPKVFNFDPAKDFTPISNLTRLSNVVVVHPSSPVKNMKELVELARSKPGQVTWGNVGMGSVDHLTAIMVAQRGGVQISHVPYKGASLSTQDLLAGNLAVKIDGYATARPLAEAGKVRILAHLDEGPNPTIPNTPAVADTFPGINMYADFVLVGPKGMPPALVDRINKEVVAVLKMPDLVAKFAALGIQTKTSTPQELGQQLQTLQATYAKAIKDGNVTLQE